MIRQVYTGWCLLSRRDRQRWAITVPLAVMAAVLEAAGAAAVYGLVKLIGDPTQLTQAPFSKLTEWLPWQEFRPVVLVFTTAVAALYLAKNLTLGVLSWSVSKWSAQSWSTLSQRLLRAYLRAPFAFHLQRNSSELVHSTIEAADIVFRLVVGPAVAMAAEILVVAGVIVVLLLTAPGVTIVAVTLLFATVAILVRTTRRVLTRWGTQEQRMREQVLKTLHQTLEGFKEVKLRGREEFFQGRFAQQHNSMNRVRHRFVTLTAISRLFVETVFIAGLLAVVVLVTLDNDGGANLVPVLSVYAYAGFRIIPSVNRILLFINQMRYGLPAVSLVWADLQRCEAAATARASTANGSEQLHFRQRLEIDGVSYAYHGAPEPVLLDIHLTANCGESIGIVGPTGAGKSTLINVVLGLLEPASGRVTVDGVDIETAMPAWQSKIGYVPQVVYLIDDTLRRNVAFALPDEEIDEAQVRQAVERAQLAPFVATLPSGLDTVVGERGVRLSGGERQRIAIARALYYQPELLVFDEATSSLDAQTERELTRAIEALHGQKTMFIVAHRLSTVRNCDRLVFLQAGKLVATGSFDELLSGCAEFRAMAVGTLADEPRGEPGESKAPA